MRVLTIVELLRLTRVQLTDRLNRMIGDLSELPEGSDEHEIALTNIRNIRYVLTRNDLRPS